MPTSVKLLVLFDSTRVQKVVKDLERSENDSCEKKDVMPEVLRTLWMKRVQRNVKDREVCGVSLFF